MTRNRHAFTLIELLVVIAILAILMAMLVPVMGRMKESARRAACTSQLRQMGTAAVAYAAGEGMYLPTGKREDGQEHCIWVHTSVHDTLAVREPTRPEDHTHGDPPDPLVVCPSLPQGFGRYGEDLGTRRGWVLGYNYLGRHPSAAAQSEADGKPWTTPIRISDSPGLVLMTDLNAWATQNGWTFVAHTARGGVWLAGAGCPLPDEVGGEGGMLLHVDGSVNWKLLHDMRQYTTGEFGPDSYPCLW
jgi:prepilin-type N-terminal cleavage/methylation domain-containing protein